MNLGEALLQASKHVAVPIERQFGVQTADNVELSDRFAPAFSRAVPHFVERPGISLGILGAFPEGAKLAARHADVGGIDVAVYVKPCDIAVLALSNQVGHIADGENIGAFEKGNAVVKIQADISLNFLKNRP